MATSNNLSGVTSFVAGGGPSTSANLAGVTAAPPTPGSAAFSHASTPIPGLAGSAAASHVADPIPGLAGSAAFEFVSAPIPSSSLGPPHDVEAGPIPASSLGPPSDTWTTAPPASSLGPPSDQASLTIPSSSLGPPSDQAISLNQAAPQILNEVVVQRDATHTFLVDVGFDVTFIPIPPQTSDLELTVEWRRGTSGAWSPATAQPFDRKHNADEIPISFPGTEVPFNFVWQAFFDLPSGIFEDVFLQLTVENNPLDTVIVGPLSIFTTTATTEADNFAASLARRALAERVPGDFLGCGLVIPFRRSSRDFANACGVDLIKASVAQILGTRAAVGEFPGDLKWRPDFGSKFWILRHRNNDPTLQEQASVFAQEALEWEPRVVVTEVEASANRDNPNRLDVKVHWRVIEENIASNRVILPDFETVVTI